MFTKNRLILMLGILVALLPFLGFPSAWRTFFYVVFGLAISTLSFLLSRHKRIVRKNPPRRQRSNEVYAEVAPAKMPTPEVSKSEVPKLEKQPEPELESQPGPQTETSQPESETIL